MAKTVSVVIVICNSLASLENCLGRLKQVSPGKVAQVVVVDNASTDGSVDAVRRELPDALIVSNDKNVGFAAACNLGAARAGEEYLLFLNPDAVLDEDCIDHLLAAAGSVRNAGLVAARLRYPDGTFQANCRNFPTVTNLLFSRGSLLARLLASRISPHNTVYSLPDYDSVTEVPAAAATATLIRRDLFERLRGFDTRFFLYMEDTDLSLRIHHAGSVNLFVPAAGAVHGFAQGARVSRIKRSWRQHQSVWKYFLKHYPTGFSVMLLPVLLTINFVLSAIIPSPRRGRS